jgi:hypothetical protein
LCGALIVLFDRKLVEFLGLPNQASLAVIGVCLIAYAAALWFNARRPMIRIVEAWIAVVMDLGWVVGSYVLIFIIPLSLGGKWMLAVVAEAVLAFAILQWIGIRRVQRGALSVA